MILAQGTRRDSEEMNKAFAKIFVRSKMDIPRSTTPISLQENRKRIIKLHARSFNTEYA